MVGATKFIPKIAANLVPGDVAALYDVRVSHQHGPCSDHPGNVFVEEEGFDPVTGKWDGSHSDVCVPVNDAYTTRERVTY